MLVDHDPEVVPGEGAGLYHLTESQEGGHLCTVYLGTGNLCGLGVELGSQKPKFNSLLSHETRTTSFSPSSTSHVCCESKMKGGEKIIYHPGLLGGRM